MYVLGCVCVCEGGVVLELGLLFFFTVVLLAADAIMTHF